MGSKAPLAVPLKMASHSEEVHAASSIEEEGQGRPFSESVGENATAQTLQEKKAPANDIPSETGSSEDRLGFRAQTREESLAEDDNNTCPGPEDDCGSEGHGSQECRCRILLTELSQMSFKSEICHKHVFYGYCGYGDHCQFAHGLHELRAKEVDRRFKTTLCANWHLQGVCNHGKRCKFLHDEFRIEASPGEFLLIYPRTGIARVVGFVEKLEIVPLTDVKRLSLLRQSIREREKLVLAKSRAPTSADDNEAMARVGGSWMQSRLRHSISRAPTPPPQQMVFMSPPGDGLPATFSAPGSWVGTTSISSADQQAWVAQLGSLQQLRPNEAPLATQEFPRKLQASQADRLTMFQDLPRFPSEFGFEDPQTASTESNETMSSEGQDQNQQAPPFMQYVYTQIMQHPQLQPQQSIGGQLMMQHPPSLQMVPIYASQPLQVTPQMGPQPAPQASVSSLPLLQPGLPPGSQAMSVLQQPQRTAPLQTPYVQLIPAYVDPFTGQMYPMPAVPITAAQGEAPYAQPSWTWAQSQPTLAPTTNLDGPAVTSESRRPSATTAQNLSDRRRQQLQQRQDSMRQPQFDRQHHPQQPQIQQQRGSRRHSAHVPGHVKGIRGTMHLQPNRPRAASTSVAAPKPGDFFSTSSFPQKTSSSLHPHQVFGQEDPNPRLKPQQPTTRQSRSASIPEGNEDLEESPGNKGEEGQPPVSEEACAGRIPTGSAAASKEDSDSCAKTCEPKPSSPAARERIASIFDGEGQSANEEERLLKTRFPESPSRR